MSSIDDDRFEIRNIESRASGVGSSLIETIHVYCDEHGLDAIASNVKDEARSFWEKMGYEEGEPGQYFRR